MSPVSSRFTRSLMPMSVREDCRHYSSRTVGTGELVQRCRVEAATVAPFACPDGCLFFEPRVIADPTWRRDSD
jgi:hypothetical protein